MRWAWIGCVMLAGCHIDFDRFEDAALGTPRDAETEDAAMDAGPPDAALDAGPNNPIVQIAAGGDVTCALRQEGELYCWGDNRNGQLGEQAMGDFGGPARIDGIAQVREVSVGEDHVCAIYMDSEAPLVACWGGNEGAQVGQPPTMVPFSTPQTLGLSGVLHVAAGAEHTCALTSDGVYCWGDNMFEQLGLGATTPFEAQPTLVAGTVGAVLLEAGAYTTCVGFEDSAECWGRNARGELGSDVQIGGSTRMVHAVVGVAGQPRAIAMGPDHLCLLSEIGELACFGDNTESQIAPGMPFSFAAAPYLLAEVEGPIAAGGALNLPSGPAHGFTCYTQRGALVCRGANHHQQLSEATDPRCSFGGNLSTPVTATDDRVTDVAAGARHLCYLQAGRVLCAGNNESEQLGDATTGCRGTFEPVEIP